MIFGLGKFQYLTIKPAGVQDAAKLYLSLPFILGSKVTGSPLFPRWSIRVRIEGYVLALRPGVANLAIATKGFETRTRRWLQFERGETFVDVGANVGYYSVRALKAGCKVIAVEPDSSNCELFRRNAPAARLVNAALGAQDGLLDFYLSPDSSLSSFVPRPGATMSRVRVMTLDSLCQDLALDHLDWVKIDAEFHEREILEGGPKSLKRVRRVVVEVAAGNMATVKETLERSGLRVADSEFLGDTTNVLAVRG